MDDAIAIVSKGIIHRSRHWHLHRIFLAWRESCVSNKTKAGCNMMEVLVYSIIFLYGILLEVLNVCIWRIPETQYC